MDNEIGAEQLCGCNFWLMIVQDNEVVSSSRLFLFGILSSNIQLRYNNIQTYLPLDKLNFSASVMPR
ncbi:hypothetical protein CDL12_16745 [Handroanthus impetiginosus]|uniref:Uncharacterized protein n=1 Tax=Handroanthus impetiginosus TaxID=429701 RepID=A0A2G9GZG4_9LAMI|nr:hypothetical protein CDL12_16745 [Handroanthus impetiginosus]